MAVNRFMQPAQQHVQSKYVPIPFDALMEAGAVAQKRYEQALAAEQGLQDLFGSVKGIDEVQLQSGQVLSAPGQERINKKVDELRTQLTQLQKENPDYTSMEYMTGLQSIYNNFKRSASTGVIGKEVANYKALQGIYENRAKSQDIMNDPSLALPLDMQLMQYAQGNSRFLNQNVGIGKYVDVGEETAKAVGDIKDTLQKMGFTGSGLEAYARWTKEKGVDANTVLAVASRRIQEPIIANTISRRAQYAALQEGDISPENVEKHATDITKTLMEQMVGTYVRTDVIDKFLRTQSLGSSSSKYGGLFSRDLAMRVPSLYKDYDISSVFSNYWEKYGQSYEATQNKEQFMKQKGIPEGSTRSTIDNRDYAAALELYDLAIKEARNTSTQMYDDIVSTLREAGMAEKDIEEALALLTEGAGLVEQEMTEKRNDKVVAPSAAGTGIVQVGWTAPTEAEKRTLNNLITKTLGPKWFEFKNLVNNSRFKKIFEGKYGTTSINTNVTNVDRDIASIPTMQLKEVAPSFNTSITDVKDTKTGESWTKKDFDKFDPDEATLLGFTPDPSQDGKTVLVYNVPSRDKNSSEYKQVKIDPPNNFDVYLKSKGYDTDFNNLITGQLYDKLEGIARQEKDVNRPYTPITLGSGDTLQRFEVRSPIKTGAYWEIDIPTKDKNGNIVPLVREAKDLTEAVNIIRDVRAKFIMNYMEQQGKKK